MSCSLLAHALHQLVTASSSRPGQGLLPSTNSLIHDTARCEGSSTYLLDFLAPGVRSSSWSRIATDAPPKTLNSTGCHWLLSFGGCGPISCGPSLACPLPTRPSPLLSDRTTKGTQVLHELRFRARQQICTQCVESMVHDRRSTTSDCLTPFNT